IRLLKKPTIRAEKISSRFQVRSVIDRIHQHADQHAGHLHADRAEDDPADPSLGLHHAARLDGDHLPDDRVTGRKLHRFLTPRKLWGSTCSGPRLLESGPPDERSAMKCARTSSERYGSRT